MEEGKRRPSQSERPSLRTCVCADEDSQRAFAIHHAGSRNCRYGTATMVGQPDITVQLRLLTLSDVRTWPCPLREPQDLPMAVVGLQWCRAANDRSGSSEWE